MSLLYCVVVLLYFSAVSGQNSCRTPTNQDGRCVRIRLCPPVLNLINRKPLTDEIIQQAQQYRCNTGNENILVCCPINSIVLSSNETQVPRVNVTGHRNINLLPTLCGNVPPLKKILTGNIASFEEHSWVVLIYNINNRQISFVCEGTLISRNYVLTSANCLDKIVSRNSSRARIGEYNFETNPDCDPEAEAGTVPLCNPPYQDIAIEEIVRHPEYNARNLQNNIGLIRLSQPARLSFDENIFISPICLPVNTTGRGNNTLERGNLCVVGWRTGSNTRSNRKQQGFIPFVRNDDCRRFYNDSLSITSQYNICAGGNNNPSSCSGDFGAPLQKYIGGIIYQYGIVSYIPTTCDMNNMPVVYTRISAYLPWILDNLRP